MRSARPGDYVVFRHRRTGQVLEGRVEKVVAYRTGFVAAHVRLPDGRLLTDVAVKRDVLAIA